VPIGNTRAFHESSACDFAGSDPRGKSQRLIELIPGELTCGHHLGIV
jgi:hypothetical protein